MTAFSPLVVPTASATTCLFHEQRSAAIGPADAWIWYSRSACSDPGSGQHREDLLAERAGSTAFDATYVGARTGSGSWWFAHARQNVTAQPMEATASLFEDGSGCEPYLFVDLGKASSETKPGHVPGCPTLYDPLAS